MNRTRRAFTRSELVVCLVSGALLAAVALPLVGAGRSRSRELVSLSNLKTLAAAHAAYAGDWGGRQFTNMPDNMALSGGVYSNYFQQFGCPPSVVLGFGAQFPGGGSSGLWGFWMPCRGFGTSSNFSVLWPMQMGTVGGTGAGFGMWRLQNVVGFNEYVNGRFMDSHFFAPADAPALSIVGPGLESPNPYTYISSSYEGTFSSYVSSPAAMFHPGVFGGDAEAEFKSPYTFTEASISPTVDQCAHPDLKTRLIEHRWLQSPAFAGVFAPPDTAYFNMGADSVPMALFFDGHTSGLPVRKVIADNQTVIKGGGAKLWMDTEITVGPWAGYEGYYSSFSIDDTRTSVHVFTRGGILGRDVLTPAE